MAATQRILEILNEQGISKTQLAEKSGLALGTISRILNGKQELKANTLSKIAEALDLSPVDITDSQSRDNTDIGGYLEYDGEITKIKSLVQLEKWVAKVKYETSTLPKEVAEIRKANKANRATVKKNNPNQAFDYNIKEFRRVEEYDATKLDVWGFKTAADTKDGIVLNLGNQCSGYPFTLNGHYFHTSESAYLCGQFSQNTPECIRVQTQLMAETNGYTAKKKVRNQNNNLVRPDWQDINAEFMAYVIWAKCKGNKDFAAKLMSIPKDAIITENSTTVNEWTNQFWGTLNPELESARDKVERYTELQLKRRIRKGEKISAEEIAAAKQAARDEIQYIGVFGKGMNFMGKILKRCQLALLNGTEPDIDYEKLRKAKIFLFGKEIEFPKSTQSNALPKGIIGAIIGDIVGSRFEFAKKTSKINKLFGNSSTFTDDTVLTVAIADALTNHKAFNEALWEWGHAYPNAGWGYSFKHWLKGTKDVQNDSAGNGSAMRVSPVGFFAKNAQETLDLARQSAEITHNSPEGIKGAQAAAMAVYLARTGKTKAEIKQYLENTFGYNLSLSLANTHLFADSIKTGERQLAQNTVPVAIISFLLSEDYEQTIRTAISFGIDTDTVACIAGGIAAAYYGVPQELIDEAVDYLPNEMLQVINRFDGSTLRSHRITPNVRMRWRKGCIVVYGTNADDTLGEDGYADTHPSNFNHNPLKGYPIHTIGAKIDGVKKDVAGFIAEAKAHPETTYLVSKVGLGKSGLGIEVIAPLFKNALGLDNVYLPQEIVEANTP